MRWTPLVVLALLAVGCGPKKFSNTSPTLRWAIRNDLKALDPIRANEENTGSVLAQVAEPLVNVSDDGKLLPGLADKWEIKGKDVTLHLVDATFSDGTPVTAADVKSSIERAGDDTLSPVDTETYIHDIASVEAPEAKTVVIRLKAPVRTFLANLSSSQLGILPARLRHQAINRPEDLVGSGPYRLTEYRPNERTLLEANPKWRGGNLAIQKIEVVPITDAATLTNRFVGKDVDILQVASSDVANVLDSKKLKPFAQTFAPVKLIYLLFQEDAYAPFKDPRVRRAFAMAMDRKRLATELVRGGAEPAVRLLPPALAEQKRLAPPYDPDGARKLLAEAGYPDGKGLPPVEYYYHEANRTNPLVDFVPTSLKTILNVKVQGKPTTDFLGIAGNRKMPIGLSGWAPFFPDPEFVLSVLLRSGSGSNFSGYHSAAFDAADAKARASGKPEDFEAAEKIALNDVPILPMYVQPKLWLAAARVKGVKIPVFGNPDFTKASLTP